MIKNHGEVCKISWIMEWYYVHLLLRFTLVVESNSMNGSKWCLMDPNWQTEVIGAYPLICWHVPYACASSKVKVLLCFEWLSAVHMVVVLCEAAIVLQSKSIKLFRDAAAGPNLSLTTDHMCLSCSLDCGGCIQWSGCRNCFWLCLLLLLTLHWCRFPFHMQDMILTRSYCRVSSLAITSVDGCCLYIIIHNSISCRTWL